MPEIIKHRVVTIISSLLITVLFLFTMTYIALSGNSWPKITGTFLQPWAFSSYTDEQWEKHCDYLLEAGIDTVIIQWTTETPYGQVMKAYYPSQLDSAQKYGSYSSSDTVTEGLLKACEEKGLKVFIGLNLADEWWQINENTPFLSNSQSQIGLACAQDLYNQYKTKYPNAFYGWYFAWEYYNGMGHTEEATQFLNDYLDGLTQIDCEMPLMMSPFIRSIISPKATQAEWSEILKNAHFRKGDILCIQDSVGAGHIEIAELEDYMRAMKKASRLAPHLEFWANVDSFTPEHTPASLKRILMQMKIEDPFVDGFITFSYSHYFSPDLQPNGQHSAYVEYYNTGTLP